MQWKSPNRLAFGALLAGATGIGFAPIFVRLSEVGPSATAFYRLFFALPFLWLAVWFERRNAPDSSPDAPRALDKLAGLPRSRRTHRASLILCILAGLLFAGDLGFWHWSIRLTSVANSTLLTNCAPFFVMLGARVLFAERITPVLLIGMAIASCGAAMLVGVSLQLTTRHLVGDFLGLLTAVFYGGYLLSVKVLRRTFSAARVLAWSGLVSCAALLVIALLSHESIRIPTGRGWMILLGLGLISHVGGQGLIAYALAHLPAGFSSVGLLFQPVVAACLAWTLLAEPLTGMQVLGGGIILAGILIASRSQRATPALPITVGPAKAECVG